MAEERELKAMVPDVDALRARLREAGAAVAFVGRMEDRRYDRGGELTGRDEVLRVRTMRSSSGAEEWHLAWKGPTRISADGYKLRDERECRVTGATSPAEILLALGYRVVHAIDRDVEMFRVGEATVRLEIYPRMDPLVEVEGASAAIEAAIAATGLDRASFTAESLAAFVGRFEARGERAVLASE